MIATLAAVGGFGVPSPAHETRSRTAILGSLGREAFGFRIGEERRYILGPREHLPAGMFATWTIRLDSIDSDGGEVRATFRLSHERYRFRQGRDRFKRVVVDAASRLTVNALGFPLELRTSETTRAVDSSQWVSTQDVEERYSDGRFEGRITTHGRITNEPTVMSRVTGIPSQEYIDLGRLRGLFLLNPARLTCVGLVRAPRTLPCTSGVPDGDPSFMNPGLLGLMLAALDGNGENETHFLAFRVDARASATVGSIHRHPFAEKSTKSGEAVDVVIGERRMAALRYEVSGMNGGIFVDPADKKVLLVEVDPDPRTRRARHIRLLLPSEY